MAYDVKGFFKYGGQNFKPGDTVNGLDPEVEAVLLKKGRIAPAEDAAPAETPAPSGFPEHPPTPPAPDVPVAPEQPAQPPQPNQPSQDEIQRAIDEAEGKLGAPSAK